MSGKTEPQFDYGFITERLAQLLLRDLLNEGSRLQFLRNFKTLEKAPGDLSVPPVVGIAITESEDGKAQLQILSTVEPRHLLLRKFLAQWNWDNTLFTVQKTGTAIPCGRPAQGGDSIGRKNGMTGTIACAVKDRGGQGGTYLLSCNHVIAGLNTGAIGRDEVWQPGEEDGGGPGSRIGVLGKYRSIQFGATAGNVFDAALCEVDDVRDVIPGIRQLGPLSGYLADPPFGLRVRKHGRTSGITRGKLRLKNLSMIVTYETGKEAVFDNQFGLISDGQGNFAQRGDSGSLVVDDDGNAVGLLFAVAAGVDLSYVSPIEPIMKEFALALRWQDSAKRDSAKNDSTDQLP